MKLHTRLLVALVAGLVAGAFASEFGDADALVFLSSQILPARPRA